MNYSRMAAGKVVNFILPGNMIGLEIDDDKIKSLY